MGTREVYEEKLRTSNLHHDPTIKPGLGSPRCPRCLSLVDPQLATLMPSVAVSHSKPLLLSTLSRFKSLSSTFQGQGEWTITPVLHDATAVAGYGIGGLLGVINGINTGIPFLQSRMKGPKWLPFVTGIPLLLTYSGATAAFGGYALPKFTQLVVTSYYAASSVSHYGVSLLTRHIEENHISHTRQERRDDSTGASARKSPS